jgi:VWFA-related protein
MMNARGIVIAVGTALLLTGAGRADAPRPGRPAAAARQASRSQTAKPLQYEVNVVLKLVQVHVTDKKGEPVRDLVREDFVVTDGGQPVEITAFEKHTLVAPSAPAAPAARPEVTGETEAPAPAGPAAPTALPARRKFFLLFDFAFNNVRGIEKAQKAALHFVDEVAGPTDEVAVLSYAAIGGLAFHEYLTTDHVQVRKVLQGIGHKDVRGRATDIEDYYWRFVQANGGPFVTTLKAQAEASRQEAEDMAQKYMLTLTDLARALRLVEGEKNFILFSTGIPSSLIYGYATGSVFNRSDVSRAAGNYELRRQNEDMYKEFGAAGCAFYAFDTRESAKGTSLFAYDEETFEQGSRAMTTINDPTTVFLDDKATGLNSLKRFTDQTGGKYYSNIAMYEKNLGQVNAATGAYYVLGFPITEKWDGAFHEVKVEVKRKGCQVRTQAGYFDPKPFAEYSDIEKQIHLFDLAINERSFSRLPGTVPMTALSYAAAGGSRLAVVARVPREITAKLTGPKVEIVALFFDDNGDIAEIVREEAATAALRGRDVALASGAALRPGNYAGRLVIRDLTTGQSAVASARATVGRPAPAGLQLGSPLVLAPGAGVPLLEAVAPKNAGHAPFGEGYPYDASLFGPVLGEVPAGAGHVAVVVPCAAPGGGEADLVLTVRLFDAVSGAQVPAEASLAGRVLNGTLEVLTLDLPVAATPPGTYYLHVYAKDRRTGALGHAVTTLVLPAR